MLEIILVGTDGTEWDLRRGTGPGGAAAVKMSDKGIQGLGTGSYSAQTQNTAGADGQQLTGWNEEPRPVMLPVRFRTTDVSGMQARFWQAVSLYGEFGPYCTLRVTDSAGVVRTQSIRFVNDGGVSLRLDPEFTGNDVYPLAFMADDPWWYGVEIVTSYSISDTYQPGFFGDGAGAPDFNIGSDTLGSNGGHIVNPGDAPAWPTIEAEGDLTRWYVYIGSKLVDFAGIVPGGSTMYTYTDPLLQFSSLNGVPMLRRFLSVEFAPLSPGDSTYNIGASGPGRVRLRFRPRYRRAY